MVEAVFIFPLLLMLVFGMVTYGTALAQRNAIENAAREASRFGATTPVSTNVKTWLDQVTGVAVAASTGDLGAAAPDRYLCVALVGTEDLDGRRVTLGASDVTYASSGGCPDTTCPSSDPCVQVVLRRSAKLEAVAFQRSITLDGSGVSAFEREP